MIEFSNHHDQEQRLIMAIFSKHCWITAALDIVALLAVDCSTTAEPTAAPVAGARTVEPALTVVPAAIETARDTVILVTNGEPAQLGAFSLLPGLQR
jgi:hypothetical protein